MAIEEIEQLAQFGLAGLMGALWLMERRHSSQRERELSQAHERLMEQRTTLSEFLDVVRDNTAALAAIREGQQRLIGACERIAGELWRWADRDGVDASEVSADADDDP